MEDKRTFVKRLNEAYVACGDGRYDFLEQNPIVYLNGLEDDLPRGVETIAFSQPIKGARFENVSGDSLTAISRAFAKLLEG